MWLNAGHSRLRRPISQPFSSIIASAFISTNILLSIFFSEKLVSLRNLFFGVCDFRNLLANNK